VGVLGVEPFGKIRKKISKEDQEKNYKKFTLLEKMKEKI
jgi:hypothetical protein